MHQFAKRLKWYLSFATGILECLGFTGVIYGWVSLVFVLKKEKYFLELCAALNNSNSSIAGARNGTFGCDLQDEHLSLVFTIASFAFNFLAFPSGALFDYFGTMATRILAICIYTTATLMMAFSTAASSTLLFPALFLMAIGGILLFITNIQVGNLFGNNRSTIITVYNGALDSSSAVYQLVKVLYEVRFSMKSMFLFITSLSSIHLLRTFFLLPRTHIPYPLPEGYNYGITCETFRSGSLSVQEVTEVQRRPDLGGNGTVEEENETEEEPEGDRGERQGGMEVSMEDSIQEGEADRGEIQEQVDGTDAMNPQPIEPQARDITGHEEQIPSFRSCIFTKIFLTHLFWLSVMSLLHNLYIGTLNPMLAQLADGDSLKVSRFTNAFAFTQLCGLLFSPFNGLIMDRNKRKANSPVALSGSASSIRLADMKSAVLSLAITVTQCLLFAIFATIPTLDVQYLTFVLQVINRAFLFGGNASFITITFPPCHFGKIFGLGLAVSAVVSLLEYPLFALVEGPLQHNPLYLNIGLIILVTLTYVHPINVYLYCRRESRREKQ
ncbi:solute carrier family 43 member 3-like [Carcharodon carcharias]|uniref:solute carrier family 43 member 3-like n=1 Tax=Carcharodon carcharias TaxID=13397 RepID=UPI001B7DDDC3|nr:solute carrier family 43 member 3-like [Carcharodon carcharias]